MKKYKSICNNSNIIFIGIGLRGSSNQNILFLTDRYKSIKETFYKKDCRNVEVSITLDNRITINGIPNNGFLDNLTDELAKEGFELT